MNTIKELNSFYLRLAHSHSYTLKSDGYQTDHQVYEKLNNQHLENIVHFIQDTDLQNKEIILYFAKEEKGKIVWKNKDLYIIDIKSEETYKFD